ncbi:MAG: hypothetical protein FJ137_15675 [Deltaproteobacteria bacterium]|nr:hypothetical protein [Deltaproteobacteria bacterium]
MGVSVLATGSTTGGETSGAAVAATSTIAAAHALAFTRLKPSPHLRLAASPGRRGGFARLEPTDVRVRVEHGTVAMALAGGAGRRVTIESAWGDVMLVAGGVVVDVDGGGRGVAAADGAAELVRVAARRPLVAGVPAWVGTPTSGGPPTRGCWPTSPCGRSPRRRARWPTPRRARRGRHGRPRARLRRQPSPSLY